jgi:hypothetical protein
MILAVAVIWFAFRFYRYAYSFGVGESKLTPTEFWVEFLCLLFVIAGWEAFWAYENVAAENGLGENVSYLVIIFSVLEVVFIAAAIILVAASFGRVFGWWKSKRANGLKFKLPSVKMFSRNPWKIYQDGGTVYRVNQFTGVKEISTPEGWRPESHASSK